MSRNEPINITVLRIISHEGQLKFLFADRLFRKVSADCFCGPQGDIAPMLRFIRGLFLFQDNLLRYAGECWGIRRYRATSDESLEEYFSGIPRHVALTRTEHQEVEPKVRDVFQAVDLEACTFDEGDVLVFVGHEVPFSVRNIPISELADESIE